MKLWHYPKREFEHHNRRYDTGGPSTGGGVTPNTPAFTQDPNVATSQNMLQAIAGGLMSGNLPANYSGLGQSNSPAFQKMLTGVNANVTSGVQNAAAAGGISPQSGVVPAAAGQAIASADAPLQYADYENALNQQMSLLSTGIGAEQGVGTTAIANQGQQNNYAMNTAQLQLQSNEANLQYQELMNQSMGSMFGSGISAGASIYGANQLAAALAAM